MQGLLLLQAAQHAGGAAAMGRAEAASEGSQGQALAQMARWSSLAVCQEQRGWQQQCSVKGAGAVLLQALAGYTQQQEQRGWQQHCSV